MEDCGKGVVVRNHIKQGDFVTLYSGSLEPIIDDTGLVSIPLQGPDSDSSCLEIVCDHHSSSNTHSSYNASATLFLVGLTSMPILGNCLVDSSKYGNMSRFLPHLPKEEELKDLNLSNIDEIATTNLNCKQVKIGCKLLPAFIATRDLKPNELMGISYGPEYWQALDKSFWLFKKTGEKLAEVKYNENGKLVLIRRAPEQVQIDITSSDASISSSSSSNSPRFFQAAPSSPELTRKLLLPQEQPTPGCWEAFKKCFRRH